jgi:hypothetical protein
MTKKILLPMHLNLDMTILCFLSGLCLRAKNLKFFYPSFGTFDFAPTAQSNPNGKIKRAKFPPFEAGFIKLINLSRIYC